MKASTRRFSNGFSLIEIMVGLAIGMAAVVIMMQMLSNSDASKRIAAGGSDAQMNGNLALYSLERDIQASGYGISAFNILGCNVTYKTSTDKVNVTVPLAPATINPLISTVPAGDSGTDTILVVYGSSSGSSEGDALIANSSSGSYQVTTGTSFNINDILIAQTSVRPTTCNLTTDMVTNVGASTVSVNPGVSGLPVGSIIYNLGPTPVVHAYAVRNGNLTMCDYTAYDCSNSSYTSNNNVWVPIAANIVAMRAQYGRDTTNPSSTMTGVVSTYDQTTPASSADKSGWTPYCSWARTLSMRLALVARSSSTQSGAYDKSTPTTMAPTWSGSTATTSTTPTNPTAVTFDLSTNNSDWQSYRYKTLETTVPLRNAIWQGGQATYQGGSGC